jgi:hypothetical protein
MGKRVHHHKIYLNGVDISSYVYSIELDAEPNRLTTAKVELPVHSVETVGEDEGNWASIVYRLGDKEEAD